MPESFATRYRTAGHWRGETFSSLLASWATRDRVALVGPTSSGGEARVTYAELHARAAHVAAGFHELGIRAGDRVIVQLPNVVEFFDVIFGLFRIGAWPVFALPSHRASEISYFCTHTEAVGFVTVGTHEGFDHRSLFEPARGAAPSLRHLLTVDALPVGDPSGLPAAPEPGDVAFLQLSGGSTGLPKLIPRTHDDYLYSVRASAEICDLDENSVYLCALPVAHNYPLSSPGVLGALYAGGRVVLCPRPSPDTAFPLIEREGVTITGLVPPLVPLWLDAAKRGRYRPATLKTLQVGGAKLAAELARKVTPILGCRLQQVFGMAEGLVCYTRRDDPAELVEQTQGRPISVDDEILVVDDEDRPVPPGETGHLLTRGPYTIRGYYRAEEHNKRAFTPDGFYRTGDIVRLTPTGHVVVAGRAKDQINRGGEKIAAAEVENHLLAHPDIADAAVVAAPDTYLGERSCAFVVPKKSTEAPTPAQVRAFVRGRGLAAYKVPDRVEIVDAFPVTAVGKVNKKELRARLEAT